MRVRSFLRPLGWVVGGTFLLVGFLVAALQVDSVATAVGRSAARLVAPEGVQIEVGRVSGTWIRGLELRDVRVRMPWAGVDVEVDTVAAGWWLPGWRWKRIRVDSVAVAGVRARIGPAEGDPPAKAPAPEATGSDPWRVAVDEVSLRRGNAEVARGGEPDDPGSRFLVEDLAVRLDGLTSGEGVAIEAWTLGGGFVPGGEDTGWGRFEAGGGFTADGVRLDTLSLESPRSRIAGGGWIPLDGSLARPGALRWNLIAAPLALADLQGLTAVPGVLAGDSLTLTTASTARGDSAGVSLEARTSQGARITADALWGRTGERWGGRLEARIDDLELRRYGGEAIPEGPLQGVVEAAVEGDRTDGVWTRLDGVVRADLSAPEIGLALDGRLGRNVDPTGAPPRDTADLRIDGLRWTRWGLEGGRVSYGRQGSEGRWAADLRPTPSGRVRGEGTVSGLGEDGLRFSGDLVLDSVPEPASSSMVSGRARVSGQGSDARRLEARVDLRPSALAGWPVDSLRLALDWTAPSGRLTGAVGSPRGRVHLESTVRQNEDGGLLRVLELAFDSLQPLPDSGQARPLRYTGRASGDLTWPGGMGSATDPGQISADLRVAVLDLGGGPALDSIDGRVRWTRGRLDAALTARVSDGGSATIRADGSVLDTLDVVVREGRLEALDLARLLPSAPATSLTGDLEARIRRAPGDSIPRVDGTVELGPSTVRAGPIDGLSARVVLTADTLDGVVDADLGGGRIHVDAAGPGLGGQGWTVTADVDVPRAGGFLDQPDTALALTGRVAASADGPDRLRADLRLSEARGWGARIDTLVALVDLDARALTVDTLILRSDVLTADGGGSLPAAVIRSGSAGAGSGADHRLAVALAQPDSTVPLVLGDSLELFLEGGRGQVEATCTGLPCDLRARFDVDAALAGDWSVRAASVVAGGTLDAGRVLLAGDLQGSARSVGTPVLDGDSVGFEATWDGAAVDGRAVVVVDRATDLSTTLHAEREDAGWAVRVDSLGLRLAEDRWTLVEPSTVELGEEGLRVQALDLSAGPGRHIHASYGPEAGRPAFAFEITGLGLSGLGEVFGRESLAGRLDASVSGSGSGPELIFDAEAAADITWEDRLMHRLTLDAGGREGEISFDAAVLDSAGATRVTAEGGGRFGSESEAGWTVDLLADSVPLSWGTPYASPDLVTGLRGTLFADLNVAGGPDGLAVNGPIDVWEGRARLTQYETTLSQISLDARAEGRSLVIQAFRAVSEGPVVASGTVSFPSAREPLGLDLEITADGFLASDSRALQALVDGNLTITGTSDLPRIEGDVRVEEGQVLLSGEGQRTVRDVTLTDEDWATLRTRFGVARPPPVEAPPWLPRGAVLDIDVNLSRDVWVRREFGPELALQFTGDMVVRKSAAQGSLSLEGDIQAIPERSYVEEFGRRFSLEEGSVQFLGPLTETRLDVTSSYEVPRTGDGTPVTIRLHLSGTLDRLVLDLSSDPAMDNGDIVSYLATGQPANSAFSGQGGSAADIGVGVVAGQLTGSLERYAREEVGLDVVEIQQDGLRGTTLVAGKYVTPRLFVGFRQGVTFNRDATNSSTTVGSNSEAEAEFQALDWLILYLRGGTSALRFFLEASYGW